MKSQCFLHLEKSAFISVEAKTPHTTTTPAHRRVNGLKMLKSLRMMTVKTIDHAVYVMFSAMALEAPNLAMVVE